MRLYLKYASIHLKSAMEYKLSFFLTVVGQFWVSFNVFLGVFFMFRRFHQVEGYTYSQCLFCFAVVLMSFSLAECVFRGFDGFARMIGDGTFDRILVRPKSIVFQVLGTRMEFTRVGRMIQSVVVFIYAVPRSGIVWTPDRIFTAFAMVLCGMAVFAGMFLIYAGLCFFTLEGLEFLNIFTDGAREYGKYPIDVYGKKILKICTYIVPYALFQYYPLRYLLGMDSRPVCMALPFAALLFLFPCYGLWRIGLRHYQSTGS